MILKRKVVGTLAVNAFIIGCEQTKEAIIIDPAGSEEKLAQYITDAELTLKHIVNTHGHPDHTCGNKKMKDLTGATVLMHEEDEKLLSDPAVSAMFQAWGLEPSPPADEFIDEGDEIKVGKLSFSVIHTPGHSPGSVCLYGEGHIVTGDTLFVGAVGRTDLPGGSMDTLIKSLKEKIFPLPDETVVLPGHDYGDTPTSTLGKEKKTNPYLLEYCF